MLPQLRELERRFADELVIIGVHAGKYPAERITENIRQAALRLDVEHPVVNDRLFRIWRSYAVSAWPTLVLIDPAGLVVDEHPGEIVADRYAALIAQVVADAEARGTLRRSPLELAPAAAGEPATPLAFPGKVLAAGDRLFVADTNHHRIVGFRLQEGGLLGSVEWIAGRGEAGLEDGSLARAAFNRPQGMALGGDVLYVADAGNHAIRAVDLLTHQVTTLAGTGEPAHTYRRSASMARVPLSSPWDVALDEGSLYIAMAGMHQIWRLDLARNEIGPYAGNGYEELMDGPATQATLAQPMGLSVGAGQLYFADSESNAVRSVDLARERVHTYVGTGLFDFGDRDAAGDDARLQHPQAVAWHEGLVYVADTYNNKIKVLEPRTRAVRTLLGTGDSGVLWEPGGVSISGDRLYVADTNHHTIKMADLQGGELLPVELEGLSVETT